jgi:hypothetical protein
MSHWHLAKVNTSRCSGTMPGAGSTDMSIFLPLYLTST